MINLPYSMSKFTMLLILLFSLQACQLRETPPLEIDLSELTIAQIHDDYENERYTSQDLIAAYLSRIDL